MTTFTPPITSADDALMQEKIIKHLEFLLEEAKHNRLSGLQATALTKQEDGYIGVDIFLETSKLSGHSMLGGLTRAQQYMANSLNNDAIIKG